MKILSKTILIALAVFSIAACDGDEDRKGRFLLKGNEKMNENDTEAAIEFYTEALKIDEQYRDAIYNRALAQQQLNRLDLAIGDFDVIIQSNPTDTLAIFQRGVCYMDNGELYKALEDTQALLKINGEYWKGFFLQGLVYEKMQRLPEAKEAFEAALELSPNNVEILVNLANIEYYLGEIGRSEMFLDRAEQLDLNEANIDNLRSLLAFDGKHYPAALALVENAIKKRPDEGYFYNNRGLYKLLLGDLENGLDDINFAIKQDPKNLFAIRNKGIYYALKGQKEMARRYLGEVREKDPEMDLVEEYWKMATGEN